MINIIVVADKSNRNRGIKSRNSFNLGKGERLYYFDGERYYKYPEEREPSEKFEETKIELCLIHGNDKHIILQNELFNTALLKDSKIIYYTGGTPKRDNPKDEIWIRSRPIDQIPIQKDEAIQIIEWIDGGGDESQLPPVLLPPLSNEYLASLAILCQGYVVYMYLSESIDKKTMESLDIKWDKEVTAFGKIKETLDDNKLKLNFVPPTKKRWWRDVYSEVGQAKLEKGVEIEWKPGEVDGKVKDMLKDLFSGKPDDKLDIENIINSYKAINKRLKDSK